MKQVIRKGLKEIVVETVPDPVVLPHHVLIRPAYSLISSGTEAAGIHQDGVLKEVAENPSHLRRVLDVMKTTGPLRTLGEVRAKFSEYAVLGYSGAGVIGEKHSTVTDLEIGEKVSYGGEGTGHGETVLAGRNLVARVPKGLPLEEASFATLGSIAINAVRTADIGLGDVVAVIGLGLVGQLVAQIARLEGAVVAAVDLRPERVALAKRLGADHGLAPAALRESIDAISSGRGADCVIVAAASKSALPAQQALAICRDRGRLVIVGAVSLEFPWNEMYLKEIRLLMARAYGPGSYDSAYEKQGQDYPVSYVRWTENRNIEEFLRLLSLKRINVDAMITHRFALEHAPEAYRTILDGGSGSLAVVLRYPDAEVEIPKLFAPTRRVEAATVRSARNTSWNVALIGAGNLAKWDHLPNLRKIPGVTLRAIYSSSGVRGKSYAMRFGAEYCCSGYDEVLRDDQINVVLITSRNQYHATQALDALRSGKHVFVEKPMALTAEECAEIYRVVRESGKQLTVGFNRRFAPYYRELKKTLANRSGPAVVACRMNSPGIAGSYWMADPAVGGAILGEACHFVDLIYWLLESEPVSVSAYSLPTGRGEPIGENNLAANFQFADGSVGSLTYCTVGSKTSAGERVEVFAPGVGASTENFRKLEIYSSARHKTSRLWPQKGYKAQLEAFFESLREGRDPQVTVTDGARATLGCLAMLESARLKQPRKIAMSDFLV
ncbi:MAG: bi-domain-containing oxidoreductase [Acidobacteriia bacterium]|nr:bi-domain-containing oxidoreductase [Terriglobia bacterium]